jgi:RNA polymerase sigma factor (sigma-70 family)
LSDTTNPSVLGLGHDRTLSERRSALKRFFLRRLRAHEVGEADDLVQEVFTNLYTRERGSGAADPIAKPENYLFMAATNVLRDRQRRRQVRSTDSHVSFDAELHAPREECTPERVYLGKEAIQRFEQAVAGLPVRMRTVFLLNRYDGMRYRDIAAALGVSESLVEKEMMRAITRLTRDIGELP